LLCKKLNHFFCFLFPKTKVIASTPASSIKMNMLTALSEAIWIHRWNRHEHVVRSCMIGLAEALLSVQPALLLEAAADIVSEAVNWLTDAARDGRTKETSDVARACASEIARHLQNVNTLLSEK